MLLIAVVVFWYKVLHAVSYLRGLAGFICIMCFQVLWVSFAWGSKAEEKQCEPAVHDMNTVPYIVYVFRLSIWVQEGAFMGNFSIFFTRGSSSLNLFPSEYGF